MPPVPEEWAFANLLEGKDLKEIRACHAYEFSRHVPAIVEAYKRDVKTGRNHVGDIWIVALSKRKPNQPSLSEYFKFRDFDFYLTPSNARKNLDLDFEMLYVRSGFPERSYFEVFKSGPPPFPTLPIPERPAVSSVSKILNGDSKTQWIDRRLDRYGDDEIDHILVRWELSDTQILGSFSKWLQHNRKVRETNKRGIKLISKYLSPLKKLGGARLAEHFPTISKAKEYCKSHGRSWIYEGDGEWSKAKRFCKNAIRTWAKRELVELPGINANLDRAKALKLTKRCLSVTEDTMTDLEKLHPDADL